MHGPHRTKAGLAAHLGVAIASVTETQRLLQLRTSGAWTVTDSRALDDAIRQERRRLGRGRPERLRLPFPADDAPALAHRQVVA